MPVSGFDCANCKAPSDQHADGHCLFSPTTYRMMTTVELVAAREYRAQPFQTYEVQGIGVYNICVVQTIKFTV